MRPFVAMLTAVPWRASKHLSDWHAQVVDASPTSGHDQADGRSWRRWMGRHLKSDGQEAIFFRLEKYVLTVSTLATTAECARWRARPTRGKLRETKAGASSSLQEEREQNAQVI